MKSQVPGEAERANRGMLVSVRGSVVGVRFTERLLRIHSVLKAGSLPSPARWNPVQALSGPTPRISTRGAAGAMVSQLMPSTGWVLQEASSLARSPASTAWNDVESPSIVIVGGENTVTFPAASGTRSFRLRRR